MTPREVLIFMRATTERRFDALDDLIYASWHEALWGHADITTKRMPELSDAFVTRHRTQRRQLSLEAEIATWDRWAKAGEWRQGN